MTCAHYVAGNQSGEIRYILKLLTCNASSYEGGVTTMELTFCMHARKGVARYEVRYELS